MSIFRRLTDPSDPCRSVAELVRTLFAASVPRFSKAPDRVPAPFAQHQRATQEGFC